MAAVAQESPDATIFAFRLLPAFLDGWLDAAPATLTLIEGAEAPGYRADSEADYARVAAAVRDKAPLLLAPENRAKWRERVRLAHAFYLDAYAAADSGWLWMYGERARWWPDDGNGRPSWEEVMPGATDALRRAKAGPSPAPSSAAPSPRR